MPGHNRKWMDDKSAEIRKNVEALNASKHAHPGKHYLYCARCKAIDKLQEDEGVIPFLLSVIDSK